MFKEHNGPGTGQKVTRKLEVLCLYVVMARAKVEFGRGNGMEDSNEKREEYGGTVMIEQ